MRYTVSLWDGAIKALTAQTGRTWTCVLSSVQLFANSIGCSPPGSSVHSRQENWSGLPFPPPGNLPNPGIKPTFPVSLHCSQNILYHLSHPGDPQNRKNGSNSHLVSWSVATMRSRGPWITFWMEKYPSLFPKVLGQRLRRYAEAGGTKHSLRPMFFHRSSLLIAYCPIKSPQ